MKNNIAIRPNGITIKKVMGNRYPLYYVTGSKNGPWDYLQNARKDADTDLLSVESAIDAVQCGATHYHVGWRQFLRVNSTNKGVYIDGKWFECAGSHFSVDNGYCINLKVMLS